MRIFVAGTGFTGSRILSVLKKAGHDVIGFNRSGRLDGSRQLKICRGNVLEKNGLEKLESLAPVDLMVSTLSGTGLKDPEAYRSLYVDGPRRIAEKLQWIGEQRVWMLGSTGVYGENSGDWVTEETTARPLHRNGRVQLEAETALFDAVSGACVFRLSGLYGPGRVRMIRQALRKRPFLKPDIWSNQIHGEDVAGLIEFLTERPEPPPRLLLVSDTKPVQRKEIFSWVREKTSCPEGCFDEDHPSRAGNRGNKRVSTARLKSLGYQWKYPSFREGLEPLLAVYPTSSS